MEDFILDFAGIDRIELRELNITQNEVHSVFINKPLLRIILVNLTI